jgi:hypothetical protein
VLNSVEEIENKIPTLDPLLFCTCCNNVLATLKKLQEQIKELQEYFENIVVGLRTAISFDDKKGKQQKEKIMK